MTSQPDGHYLYVVTHVPGVRCRCKREDPLGSVRGAPEPPGVFWEPLILGDADPGATDLVGLVDERAINVQTGYCERHLIAMAEPVPPQMPPCYRADRVPLPDRSRRIIIISTLEGRLRLAWSGIRPDDRPDETSRFRSVWTIRPLDVFGWIRWGARG